jgi:hypothetical protein
VLVDPISLHAKKPRDKRCIHESRNWLARLSRADQLDYPVRDLLNVLGV